MKIIGNYEINEDDILGTGSFSIVYKGKYIGVTNKSVDHGNDVAIKIIKINKMTDKSRKVIDDEIYIMNMIKIDPHPNIVECYDVIRDPDNIYIIMEFCDSGDLRNILRSPIKEIFVQFYFSQLANGLKYLDTRNIIHRDIKPRNILLTKNRRILKIADFGFAKKTNGNSLYDTICGSPMYMAPEILDINKQSYDVKTDLWSIGMILYEMLYGEHPYQGCKSIPELREKNKSPSQIRIPPVDTKNTNVSNECISLLKMLLKRDSKERITWNDFFTHSWLNIYQYVSIKTNIPNDKYEEQMCSVEIGSLKNRNNTLRNFKIIDNYIDKYDRQHKLSESTNSIDDKETDECMFKMEE
jgi:serine/threonine protein kinase